VGVPGLSSAALAARVVLGGFNVHAARQELSDALGVDSASRACSQPKGSSRAGGRASEEFASPANSAVALVVVLARSGFPVFAGVLR
jgi:hypothetical protein